jgi:ACS family hexuronate transporter-like MFS transporter
MIKIRGLRWWMISLSMLGSVINYLTRSTLAVSSQRAGAGGRRV